MRLVLREFTVNKIHTAENSVLLLDEPEAALSLRNQYRLVDEIKNASKTNQIIFSTHSLVLIQSFEEVYDLEKCCWINSEKFITEHRMKKQ